jgi:hypothetical protein
MDIYRFRSTSFPKSQQDMDFILYDQPFTQFYHIEYFIMVERSSHGRNKQSVVHFCTFWKL